MSKCQHNNQTYVKNTKWCQDCGAIRLDDWDKWRLPVYGEFQALTNGNVLRTIVTHCTSDGRLKTVEFTEALKKDEQVTISWKSVI